MAGQFRTGRDCGARPRDVSRLKGPLMADLGLLALTFALFALLALVLKGVERL